MTRLVYIVNVDNISKVTGVYIYEGDKKGNESVVLDLLNVTRKVREHVDKILNVTDQGKLTGTVSIGGITKDDLQGPLKGKSLSDLHKLMLDHALYVTVDTTAFPHGEILGDSFVGIDRLFPDFTDIRWD